MSEADAHFSAAASHAGTASAGAFNLTVPRFAATSRFWVKIGEGLLLRRLTSMSSDPGSDCQRFVQSVALTYRIMVVFSVASRGSAPTIQ